MLRMIMTFNIKPPNLIKLRYARSDIEETERKARPRECNYAHARENDERIRVFTIVCHERDSACEHLTAASHAIPYCIIKISTRSLF